MQKIKFNKGTRQDVSIAIEQCIKHRRLVTVYFGNSLTGVVAPNSSIKGEFVVAEDGYVDFKKQRTKSGSPIDTDRVVLIESKEGDVIYVHPTLYTIDTNLKNKEKVSMEIPNNWVRLRDPHHPNSVEWTYYQGDFYHRNLTQSKWVRSSKSHLTPNRVVMFHELLIKLGNIV